jgi:hypothetical protein
VKRIILFGLLGGMLVASSGCCLCQAVLSYRPCCGCGDCVAGGCGDGCDEGCGPACGPRCPARPLACAPRCARTCGDCDAGCETECGPACRAPCGRSCNSCCDPCGRSCNSCCNPCGRSCNSCCDPCGDPCGDGCCERCWHRGPLSCLFGLFTPCCWCGRGCGDRYWGDFYSDPPNCWDPCDCHGNYTGGGCHHGGGECRNCGGGYVDQGATVSGEKIISQTDQAVGPTPRAAQQPHKAVRPQSEE